MKPKVKLIAIIGSQRKNGNSYLLAKTVLDSTGVGYDIIQLADEKIEFCNLCEKCLNSDCVLEDDFDQILEKMKNADGIVFVVPKYIFLASKFLCFLERLATIQHMREHVGYKIAFKNPDYKLFPTKKPFCILVGSGTGKIEKETLQIVADYIEGLGLKLVPHDLPPFLAVSVKAGDDIGEVLRNKEGMEECKKMIKKLVDSIKSSDSGTLHS
jgi:multimeric flavodoxin WrbA